ncbi:MAG: hypothetical protein RMK35_06190 [Aquificaceae bacterium]|nr:hypothetical protein [Aquificaceae bacterium]
MWKTITLQPPSFDKRAFNNKSAKALSQHLFSVFLSFNRLLFEKQVEKAYQVLQDVRDGKDFKRWLFQEFK